MKSIVALIVVGILQTPAFAASEIFLAVSVSAGGTSRFACANQACSTAVEAVGQYKLPTNLRLSNLRVICLNPMGAVGSGRQATFSVRKNGAAGNGSCTISETAQSCEDNTGTDDFSANDLLGVRGLTGDLSLASANPCFISFKVTANGSSAAHNPLMLIGGQTANIIANNQYCGPQASCVSNCGINCAATTEPPGDFIVPNSGAAFSGLCVELSSVLASGNTETFTLRNSTTGSDTAVTCTITGNGSTTKSCCDTSHTATPAAGDRLTIKTTFTGTATSFSRQFTLEYSGIGTILPYNAPFRASTAIENIHAAALASQTTNANRAAEAVTLRNLMVFESASPSVDEAWVMYAADAVPPAGTSLGCTVTAAGTTCSDTTNHVDIADGGYFAAQIGSAGGTGSVYVSSVEMVDRYTPTSTPTGVPSVTPSPTPTHTPLPTDSPTPAPTATRTHTPATTPPASATPTAIETASPTPIVCPGDCDTSGEVTVNEIIILVNIALGTADASACPHGIPSGLSDLAARSDRRERAIEMTPAAGPSGAEVDITLIIQAVNAALTSCPAA